MSSALLFACGAGVGALVATCALLVMLALAMRVKGYPPEVKEYNERTIKLMEERNDIENDLAIHVAHIRLTLEKEAK